MKPVIATLSAALILLSGCSDLSNGSSLTELLDGTAVTSQGNIVSPDYVLNTDYLVIYYGASWNPASQSVTKDLVAYYNKEKGGLLFQVLYISDDHSEREMYNYMKTYAMPWPTVLYHSKSNKILKERYGDRGSPRLILMNRKGRLLADTYRGNKYLGPNHVITELDKLLNNRKHDPAGISEATGQHLPTLKMLTKKYSVDGFGAGGPGGKVAFINGKVRQQGTELETGIRIEEISDTYVEISYEGNRYRLKPEE